MKTKQSKEPFVFFSLTESETCPLFLFKGRSESHENRFSFYKEKTKDEYRNGENE